MPSRPLLIWKTSRSDELDEMRAAHTAIGGSGRGRRYATQQINRAYLVLLSSQFQGFCRDLHSEAVDVLVRAITPISLRTAIRARFTDGRKLDSGNPTPRNLGSDFRRLGMNFWPDVTALHALNARRRAQLEAISAWRNAIAHQDFGSAALGGATELRLAQVVRWRSVCDALVTAFDRAVADYVERVVGTRPW
jgi:hypothetical protein